MLVMLKETSHSPFTFQGLFQSVQEVPTKKRNLTNKKEKRKTYERLTIPKLEKIMLKKRNVRSRV